jgi:beta-ureidopropionase
MAEGGGMVRVATVSQEGLARDKREELIDLTFERMDQAGTTGPDIICLPEGFTGCNEETSPGEVTERVGAWAREHRCWVVCSMKIVEEGKRFNSAIIIDREGALWGRYDKIHPTDGEIAAGVRPGTEEPPVFETDFGVIGVQICFDVNWPEGWRRLKEKGAKVVFYPAAYPAHGQLITLAQVNQYYVVSSTRTRPSRVYDITGRVLGQSGYFSQWTSATLSLDKRLFEIDGHGAKVREMQKKYGERIEVVWYHDEDWFTLASLDTELPLTRVMAEFEMIPLTDYIAQSEALQKRARG